MIPKIIHYCWFGRKAKPPIAKKCIASWKKYCPDYQIIEWNEDNTDLSSAPLYVHQAMEAEKWAFATDYIRLKVVYDFGGIYLDTDVELIKDLEKLRDNTAYIGFEDSSTVATGLGFGAEKHLDILLEIMGKYDNSVFAVSGKDDYIWNTKRETEVFLAHGLELNGKEQIIDGKIHVYPQEFFHPLQWEDIKPVITPNTISIHWYASSWGSEKILKYRNRYYKCFMYVTHAPNRALIRLLGKDRYERIKYKMKKGSIKQDVDRGDP